MMVDGIAANTFRLAKMSPLILALTLLLLGLPVAFVFGTLRGAQVLAIPAVLIVPLYAWVWVRMRPSRFVVQGGGFEVVWPLKRHQIAREDISSARVVDRRQLKTEIGWGMRVGVGGLWGGFGQLWTRRRGVVQMYISRTDRFVWIESARGRPWLITPENPEAFVYALSNS
jgi:Bacterial PH domain